MSRYQGSLFDDADDHTRAPYEVRHNGFRRETDLARAFWIGTDRFKRTTLWVPKSVIIDEDDTTVTVPTWFAEKEGL